ncbi:hypothetical protein VTO42DRAFT_6024 [Malbranchea cinnamomea]
MQSNQPVVEVHRHAYDKSTYAPISSHPFLEFLYPPRTQSFARYYRRNPGTILSFRKKRRVLTRGLTTSVGPHQEQSREDQRAKSKLPIEDETTDSRSLKEVLETQNPEDYDKAWELFQKEGSPQHLASALLLYLSSSDRPVDVDRAASIFDLMPVKTRKARDYWCSTKAAFRVGRPFDQVAALCKEAISQGEGELCWGLALALFVNRMEWSWALEIWENKPSSSAGDGYKPLSSAELSVMETLPDRLLSLLDAIENNNVTLSTPAASCLAKFLVNHVVSSRQMMLHMPMPSVLQLFQRLASMQLIESRHYFIAISTLQSLDVHQATTRSILIYRNFRFRMPTEVPPEWIFTRILRRLCALRVSEGVDYLLDEFRSFYQKPSLEAYQHALTTYARLGDIPNVERLFQNLVQDHGPPADQKLLSPLVYARARLGDVEKSKQRLQELAQQFPMKPNVVCWNIILAAHAKANDLPGAISTFTEMRNAGVEPDSHSYGTIMALYAKRGDVDAVTKLFYAAQRAHVPLKSTMIDTVVEALCNNGNLAGAEKMAREALSISPSIPLTRAWNLLLWNYAFTADVDSVSRIQNEMRELGVKFDSMTYAALMLSLVLIRDTESARKILRKLHQSGRIHVNEFHYSILMHGYFKEKNRDMVHILYKEMVERFGDPGPSSNLSMLRTLIQRDVRRYNERDDKEFGPPIELTHSERFLEAIMESFNVQNYAASYPQPGSQRRSLREAFPSAYYEFVIAAYGARGAFQRAIELFEQYSKKVKSLSNPKSPPLQMLYVLMGTYCWNGKHDEVDKCWEMAYQRVLDLATPVDFHGLLLPSEQAAEEPSREDNSILPFHRYSLSQCLNPYLESLAARGLWSKIREVVDDLQKVGFALTTQNWSLYVRLLCQSTRPAEQFLAFTIFEDKFIDNFPGWKYLKLGFVKRPPDAPPSLDLLDRHLPRGKRPDMIAKTARRAWQKIRPDYLQPSYVTMMHLASALIDFRMRSIVDGGKEMESLLLKAPKTVRALITLPYFREKFQGILLRGRQFDPDKEPPREIKTDRHVVWTGGLLGDEGEERIDTRPIEVVSPPDNDLSAQEGEWQPSGSDSGRYEDNQNLDWDWEPAGTSEPDSETLERLLAEDEQWRMSGDSEEGDTSPEKSVSFQDEFGLEQGQQKDKT